MGGEPPYLELFVEETNFYNSIVLGTIFPLFSFDPFPHILQTWLRNCIGGLLIYFLSGFLWCFYIYYWKRNVYVPKGVCLFLLPSMTSKFSYLGCVISLCSLLGPFLIVWICNGNLDLCVSYLLIWDWWSYVLELFLWLFPFHVWIYCMLYLIHFVLESWGVYLIPIDSLFCYHWKALNLIENLILVVLVFSRMDYCNWLLIHHVFGSSIDFVR